MCDQQTELKSPPRGGTKKTPFTFPLGADHTLESPVYSSRRTTVYRVPGKDSVVKVVNKDELNAHELRIRHNEEIVMRALLGVDGFVQLHDVWENDYESFISMERGVCDMYDLIHKSGTLSERIARLYFKQMVEAVHALHFRGFVHRDVKLENFVVFNNRVTKLADFGMATHWKRGMVLTRPVGTLYYASPEIVNAVPYEGPAVDVWSLGVVIYGLVTRRYPFHGKTPDETANRISSGSFERGEKWESLSPPLQSLISGMLEVNVRERMSTQQALDHPWLAEPAEPRRRRVRIPLPSLPLPSIFRGRRANPCMVKGDVHVESVTYGTFHPGNTEEKEFDMV